jgi:DNA-binding YbaB/EbfC family protein
MNVMKMMKQAASMQKNMQKMQEELAAKNFEFSAGGGMVTAVVKGDMTLQSLKIDPKAVDPSDVEMLQDLVVTAINGAFAAAREEMAEEMGKITGGMGLGGMGIPGLG